MITLYNENDVRIRDIWIYEINDADMGESTITASVKFDQVMQFHPDWYVLLDGEKYKLGVTEPSGKRSTTQINVEYSLTFHSSREDLKRYTFMDFVDYGSGNPQPSQHTFNIQSCTLAQFVSRFNTNLRYYLGSLWTMELSDDADPTVVADLTFDKASLWDVLLNLYDKYGVRWTIHNDNGIMTIVVGKEATELQTIFEYGNGNGLISVERTNPMERIVTRLRGKGSERNLPANYFHAATSAFPIGDPDTNSILQGIYYNRLYPKCYRDYVRGYNSGQSQTGESWAYQQGVADKVAGRPMNIVDFAKSDKEALWGISYGAIEDNDAIYPTLQGATRDGVELDRVLAVSPIYIDSPDDEARAQQFTQANGAKGSFQGRDTHILYNERDGGITNVTGSENAKSATADSDTFTLETAFNTVKAKFLVTPTKVADFYANSTGVTDPVSPVVITVAEMAANHWNFIERIQLINVTTGAVLRTWDGNNQDFFDVVADDIPAGIYKFRSYIQWYKNAGYAQDKLLYTIDWQLYGCEFATYQNASSKKSFSETFDIWVGNIWNTTKRTGESDEDYAFRVWSPLVSKDEMAVMFSDGLLAGEDYEFTIVGAVVDADNLEEVIKRAIHYDTSVTGSHWRLSLKKSDAEFEASGKYLPNSVVSAVAGNHFFFINILMPYDPYVYDAERRQQEYLEEQLSLLDVELPTFAVVPSSVFMASFQEYGDVKPGNKIRLRDTSLIGSSYTTVYIQSVSKRYTENKINPDWSLVVSDQIIVSGNPISLIDGKVEALSRQMYSSKQATRDAIEAMSQFYLRKDGLADTSFSRTDFRAPVSLHNRLADYNFRQGDFGGYGFGIYTDPDGNRVVEADVLVGRMALRVNELVVNQVDYVGGQKIYSAAAMTISKVESTSTVWRCYFDSKQGTVRNMFLAGDLAFCQRFKGTEEGGYTTYWAKITAIGSDYIEISKTDKMSGGSGYPSVGDNIIQLGNVSDVNRQSAIIMSSYGNNSPSIRLYHGIDQYNLADKDIYGVEYDAEKGQPHFFNYGSMWLGTRPDSEDDGGYIMFDPLNGLSIVIAGKNFKDADGTTWASKFKNLQDQIDGTIESWFKENETPDVEYIPAPNDDTSSYNYPASEWIFNLYAWVGTDGFRYYTKSTTPSPSDSVYNSEGVTLITVSIISYSGNILHIVKAGEAIDATRNSSYDTQADSKEAHLNDTFTNITTGRSWRWVRNSNPPYTYKWVEITDTATTEALRKAAEAKDIADGKRRTFLSQPTTAQAYDVGDIWVNATYGTTYKNEVLVCITAKAAGQAFSINHWKKADNYATVAILEATEDSILAVVANSYASKSELSNYLTKTAASNTYATISRLVNNYYTCAEVDRYFAEKSELSNYLPTSSFGSYFSSAVTANQIANYNTIASLYYNKTDTDGKLKTIDDKFAGYVATKDYASLFATAFSNARLTSTQISEANLVVGTSGANNSFAALYASSTTAALGTDGQITKAINSATSGLVVASGSGSTSFATLFSTAIGKTGVAYKSEIATFAGGNNANIKLSVGQVDGAVSAGSIALWAGGTKTGMKLAADEINFIGKTIINGNFIVDNSGNLQIYGGIKAYKNVSSHDGTNYVLDVTGNTWLSGNLTHAGGTVLLHSSGSFECITNNDIKLEGGLMLWGTYGSGSIPSKCMYIRATGNVSLPSPSSSNAGKIIIIANGSGGTISVSGTMRYGNTSQSSHNLTQYEWAVAIVSKIVSGSTTTYFWQLMTAEE